MPGGLDGKLMQLVHHHMEESALPDDGKLLPKPWSDALLAKIASVLA